MPFDGASYLTASTTPSLWSRLSAFLKGVPPVARSVPPSLLRPDPASEPDALTLQILTIGRALIEDRKDWVQRRYETRDGRRCAVGALRCAARLLNVASRQTGATAALLSVAMTRGFSDIESMNDNSTHRQVLSAFDEAMTRLPT